MKQLFAKGSDVHYSGGYIESGIFMTPKNAKFLMDMKTLQYLKMEQ